MVLTVIFEEVDWALLGRDAPISTWSIGRPVYDIEYADNTLLMGLTRTQIQAFLSALEEHQNRADSRPSTASSQNPLQGRHGRFTHNAN